MSPADFDAFMRGLDRVLATPQPAPRFYWESDGGYCGSLADMPRTYYVCHTRTLDRFDCETKAEAKDLAANLNLAAQTV